MSTPAIELRGVTVRYGATLALEGVDLVVPRGDFVALIGPNGGGKTTLLRVLLGLVAPDEGSVEVLGLSPREARGRIGYVPQFARFDASFPARVLDVVVMGRLRRPASWTVRLRAADRAAALRAIQEVGLSELVGRPVRTLSGGELQRVLIARALAPEPELLLLDEPTASLDMQSAAAFYSLLERLGRNRTVLLSSHDVTGVSQHIRTIACLNRRIFWHGDEIPAQSTLANAYGCPIELIEHSLARRVLRPHAGVAAKEGGGT